jgi:EAL domain-containing protein (putative c-di-GMP-specific phosphodiesterase class I)/GGDEF domain-containing protein
MHPARTCSPRRCRDPDANLNETAGKTNGTDGFTQHSLAQSPSIGTRCRIVSDIELRARVAFQPMIDIATGAVVAHEALSTHDEALLRVFDWARVTGRLAAVDVELAAGAARSAAEFGSPLPVQVRLMPETIAGKEADYSLPALAQAVEAGGRRPRDVVVAVGEQTAAVSRPALLRGLRLLADLGFGVWIVDVGDADAALWLLAEAEPDLVKLGPRLLSGIGQPEPRAVAEGICHFCDRLDLPLAAAGIETADHLLLARDLGVRFVQGDLFAAPHRRPVSVIPPAVDPTVLLPAATGTGTVEPAAPARRDRLVSEFAVPAVTLPVDSEAETVRKLLASNPVLSSIVLTDEHDRPVGWLDRGRFLLAVAGPFGHALNARRPVARLAEAAPVIPADTTAVEALAQLAARDPTRAYDDFVLVDEYGRCAGLARVTDLLKVVADLREQAALGLSPLTRLPGTAMIEQQVGRRIAARHAFALSWVDIDNFKRVNDEAGFAAGDAVIRRLGVALSTAATPECVVGHVGGDDFLLITGPDPDPVAVPVLRTDLAELPWPVTVSMATVICPAGSLGGYPDVSRLLVPLKRQAKSVAGASWVVGIAGQDGSELRYTDPMRALA